MSNAGFSVSNQWHTFPESSVRVQGLEGIWYTGFNRLLQGWLVWFFWQASKNEERHRKKRFTKVDWSVLSSTLCCLRWTWSCWGRSGISWCSIWNAWSSSGIPQIVQWKSSSTIRVTDFEKLRTSLLLLKGWTGSSYDNKLWIVSRICHLHNSVPQKPPLLNVLGVDKAVNDTEEECLSVKTPMQLFGPFSSRLSMFWHRNFPKFLTEKKNDEKCF